MTDEKLDELLEEFIMGFRSFLINSKTLLKETLENFEYGRPLFEIMRYVNCHGKVKMTDIGKELLVSKPYVTSMVDKLYTYGLVYREHDETDRRIIFITLSDKGKATIEEYDKAMKIKIREKLTFLSEEELLEMHTMVQSMKKLAASKFFNIKGE